MYKCIHVPIVLYNTKTKTLLKSTLSSVPMAYNKNNSFKHLWLLSVFVLSCSSTNTGEAQPPFTCNRHDNLTKSYKFCEVSTPITDKVKDLIGWLTLQEKIVWLVDNATAVPWLGIQRYAWWFEALHGVSNVGQGSNSDVGYVTKFGVDFPRATSFP